MSLARLASTRGTLALYKTAQALAALRGRDYVIPDDVKQLLAPCLAHRLVVAPGREEQAIFQMPGH